MLLLELLSPNLLVESVVHGLPLSLVLVVGPLPMKLSMSRPVPTVSCQLVLPADVSILKKDGLHFGSKIMENS